MKKLFVCLFAVSMALVLVGSAVAADWSFYGSARTGTWWLSRSGDTGTIYSNSALSGNGTGDSDLDMNYSLQGNARVGAKVRSGDISGRFEYGASGGTANIRILKGVWDFGAGEFTVGQDYTPISWLHYSNQVLLGDEGMLGFGLMYTGRKPMLQLKYGGFKVALIKPDVISDPKELGPQAAIYGGEFMNLAYTDMDIDVVLPKIEVAYHYAADNFFVDVGAGFQSHDYTYYYSGQHPEAKLRNTEQRASLTSWVVGIGGGYNFDRGYAKLQLNYDTNGAAYGLARYASAGALVFESPQTLNVGPYTTYLNGDTEFKDVNRFGAVLTLGGKINNIVGVELGAGMQRYDNDYLDLENTVFTTYLQVPFTVANNVSITPEVGYIDWGDIDGTSPTGKVSATDDVGDAAYFGISSKIHF